MTGTPPHGTPRRYRHGPDENDRPGAGCRCAACRAATTRAAKILRLKGPRLTDAEPVRRHVAAVKASGLPYTSIAKIAQVSYSVLARLMYGAPAAGRPPSARIRKEHARAFLAVRPHQAVTEGRILAAGTVRRLQALACMGWPKPKIGEHAGMHPDYVGSLARGARGATVTVATAERVRDVYKRLWDADPLADGVSPVKAAQVRTMALKRGWQPPAAWDDDLIDLSDEDLAAKLRRQAEQMTQQELAAAHNARHRYGDTTPLTLEAVREYKRRQRAQKEMGEAS